MDKTIRVLIHPEATGPDNGEGGVGRIIRLQNEYMNQEHWSGYKFVPATSLDDADVLACHITAPEEYLRQRPNIPLVGHIHGFYWQEYDWKARWFFQANKAVGELVRLADVVTSPSKWVTRVIRQQFNRNPITIYHAVDPYWWRTVPETDGAKIIVNGTEHTFRKYVFFDKTRTDPVCETDTLAQLAAMLPSVAFVSTAPVSNAPGNVYQVGKVPFELAAYLMKNASVYLATTRETFGVSNLQALACNVPIAGYDWGGQHEILGYAESSERQFVNLVRPGDARALAETIYWILQNPPKQTIENDFDGISLCEKFPIQTAIAQYQDSWYEAYMAKENERNVPDVSVVITAYNLDKYLPAAIDSAIAQRESGLDVEVVIVDDKSPDSCGAIADNYAVEQSGIIAVHNERNLYQAGARNAGIRASTGRYIMPLDADDRLAPDALQILVNALDNNRSIDLAYGNVRFCELDGREWHSGWPTDWNAEAQIRGRNHQPYATLFRRRVFDITGGYRTRCNTADDPDMWMRSALAGFRSAKVTNEDTLLYLIRPDSMTHTVPLFDWSAWSPRQLPAGLASEEVLPIPSLDPPVIAVIIPVGDGHGKLVLDALDSLYAQSFINWECIVVDDTVTDRLPTMPPWARVIRTGGIGPAAARNTGIRASTAELFIPLDADDILEPFALEIMHDAYIDSGGESIVYSDFWEDPEEENKFRVFQVPDYECHEVLRHALHAVTALTPKRYWFAVGGYDASLYGWEDWAFQLSCAAAGFPSRRVPLPLVTYRKWTGFRRDDNASNFEKSKADMLAKFGEYWEGKELMACGCGKKTISTFTNALTSSAIPAEEKMILPQIAGATLVEYVGDAGAKFSLRGPSGTTYRFSSKDKSKYVLNEDLNTILRQPDFELVQNQPVQFAGTEPVLQALVPAERR